MRERAATSGVTKRAFASLLLAFLVLAVPASAQAGWSTPVSISGAGLPTSQVEVAGNSQGTAWVVWKQNVGGFDVIRGSKVTIDGSATPPQTISAPDMQADSPVVEIREDGSAMVAWLNLSALDDTVHSRSIAADGTFGPIETRSAVGPAGQPAADISIALAGDGSAALAWRKFNGLGWVVQGVRVGADGTSGTIHNLSDPGKGSADVPDIAASPLTHAFTAVWAQGSGDTANVFAREIAVDGSLGGLVQMLWPTEPVNPGDPIGIGTGGDPHDAQVVFGSDNQLNLGWVRYRTSTQVDPDDPGAGPFTLTSWAVEQFRGTLDTTNPPPVAPATTVISPWVRDKPVVVDDLKMIAPAGALPIAMWRLDQGGGASVFQSARYIDSQRTMGWGAAGSGLVGTTDPTIAANKNFVGIIGWEQPAALSSSWTRFSNTAFDNFTPAGFVSVTDPGFVVADSNVTLAVFNGSTGVPEVMLSRFTAPMITTSPSQIEFGRLNLGFGASNTLTIRSSGETAGEVTGIQLTGPDAAEFTLVNDGNCVRVLEAQTFCSFQVRFDPQSTGPKSATVTVESPTGNQVTTLSGTGGNGTRLSVKANPARRSLRAGKVASINLTVRNLGLATANNVRVCANMNKRVLKLAGSRCRTVGAIGGSQSRRLNFRVRLTWRAKQKTVYPVTFRVRSNNAVQRLAQTKLRRKR